MSTQFFCRQPKSIELIQTQTFDHLSNFDKPDKECRVAIYSPKGDYFAYTQPDKTYIIETKTGSLYSTIEQNDTFDLHWSPLGSFLCLWTKPIKDEVSGNFNDNILIYEVASRETKIKFSNKIQSGWKPQFTTDEKLFARDFQHKEIHFFDTTTFNVKPTHKFKMEQGNNYNNFQISPGKNPAIAIFIPEKNGKPASVKVYNIPNFNQPICQKNFFKADRCQLKWNSLGTALLALASVDFDAQNKSYYGETYLYLLGIAGSYDSRITLDKEGPIHDITWSPSAREFGVVYGYMPAKTTFFDARGNPIHSLPAAPRNTMLFSPHAKFVLVAGFGNLQGTVDVYDRQQKFNKICTIEATNTSVCQWSPDGRFILTATTSPRLRVDNGLKIWHASGKLIYMKEYSELLSIDWKPQPVSDFPPLKVLEPSPESHDSVKEFLAKQNQNKSVTKSTGAYRPPHARNGNSNHRTTINRDTGSSPSPSNSSSQTYQAPKVKVIPGAPIPKQTESKSAAKNRKKREAKKDKTTTSTPPPTSSSLSSQSVPTTESPPAVSDSIAPSISTNNSTASSNKEEGGSVVGGIISFEEKKIRSLLKKLRAIENLKMKQANGEVLEDTQNLKIQTEDKIRSELSSLGWVDE